MTIVARGDMVCEDTGTSSTSCGNTISCSHVIDDVTPDTYNFSVQAIDSNGNVGEYSDEIMAQITP